MPSWPNGADEAGGHRLARFRQAVDRLADVVVNGVDHGLIGGTGANPTGFFRGRLRTQSLPYRKVEGVADRVGPDNPVRV